MAHFLGRASSSNSVQPGRNFSSRGSPSYVNNNKWSTADLVEASKQLPARLEELEEENKELRHQLQSLRESKESYSNEKEQLLVEVKNLRQRHAAMAERKVNMDQRRTENTLSTNRQSDLENQYKNDFRDGRRMDAIDAIETKLKKSQKTEKLPMDDQLKAWRLACCIFEISYECALKARETFITFYSSLLDTVVTDAPTIGSSDSKYKKLNDFKPKKTSTVVTQESSNEVMVLVKEAAERHNLESLVQIVKKEVKEKWKEHGKQGTLPSYDKCLKKELKSYIQYCTQFSWRIVTQVPPLKIDYKTTTYNPAYHSESQAFMSSAPRHTPQRWATHTPHVHRTVNM
ncbi:hypothetical protein ACROYT_G033405 [Oculina patagonica]